MRAVVELDDVPSLKALGLGERTPPSPDVGFRIGPFLSGLANEGPNSAIINIINLKSGVMAGPPIKVNGWPA